MLYLYTDSILFGLTSRASEGVFPWSQKNKDFTRERLVFAGFLGSGYLEASCVLLCADGISLWTCLGL